MAATPRSIDEGKEAWRSYVVQRTKALPKNSLFGTSLENADKTAANAIDAKEYEKNMMTARQQKFEQYNHKLPSRLQNKTAKNQVAEDTQAINKEKNELDERQVAVRDMENRAKYFQEMPAKLMQNEQIKKKMLLADPGLDFELTKKMNKVGYAEKNAYNKDKHRQRPPVHKYAVIGDPLEYGMDFSLHQTETHEKYNGITPTYDTSRFYRKLRQHKSAPAPTHKKGEIPANIRAMYGSQFVDRLFADKDAVDRVKQQMTHSATRRQRKHEKMELPPIEVVTPRNYGDLSHALRQDKFGGYTFHQPTLMKESHTQEVYDRRYPDPDEFRHHWDEYGKWKEKELCREKMDRDYEEFIDSLPKLAANWDRDVKAPPHQKEAPPMKQAKKPKPRKQVPNKNAKAKEEKPLFEDVVFVTPPMTPEPIPSFVPVANVKKEPDDFWDFYDKGLPPV